MIWWIIDCESTDKASAKLFRFRRRIGLEISMLLHERSGLDKFGRQCLPIGVGCVLIEMEFASGIISQENALGHAILRIPGIAETVIETVDGKGIRKVANQKGQLFGLKRGIEIAGKSIEFGDHTRELLLMSSHLFVLQGVQKDIGSDSIPSGKSPNCLVDL
jgi:hypothetical protein